MKTAYAVLAINKKTRQVKGVGVFGEPDPGFPGIFCIVLFTSEAGDYEAAHLGVLESLDRDPTYAWLKPVVEWKRGELGRPGETVEIEDRLTDLEEKMERVLGHLVLD